MRKHIVVGASLLLTLGTAVAGSLIYGQEGYDGARHGSERILPQQGDEPTSEMIALWKATAVSGDYSAPKLPI